MQKTFAMVALQAAFASANHYQPLTIGVDSSSSTKYIASQDWSTAYASGNSLEIGANNNIFLKSYDYGGTDYAYKPYIRGGMVSFDVDLSENGCGCVASVHAVALDEASCNEDARTGEPSCTSFDIMQANKYGFQLAAHPCEGGNCDAYSQCQYNMMVEGVAEYGEDAYRPGGSMIDTDYKFNVKTEFLATSGYAALWGFRTRITQGANEIELFADCTDYLSGDATYFIEGNVGFVFSNWDNGAGFDDSFVECPGECPAGTPSSCDASSVIFENFQVQQYGYIEDQPIPDDDTDPVPDPDDETDPVPDPDDETLPPTPADWVYFDTSQMTMMTKGLDGQQLSSDGGSKLMMGPNNRGFVFDVADDSDVYYTYKYDYLGATLDYDVNVSQTDCACAAGLFLVEIDNDTCTWDAYADGVVPQCASIDLMEANVHGFNTAAHPCPFGVCDPTSQCKARAQDHIDAYGPGAHYQIDSTASYHVKTQFFSVPGEYGWGEELLEVRTTLIQNGNEVVISLDCPDYLADLSYAMGWYDMTLGVSTYALPDVNELAFQQCEATCQNGGMEIENFVWTRYSAWL